MKELFKLTLPVFLVAAATAVFGLLCDRFSGLVFAIIEFGSIVTMASMVALNIGWFIEYVMVSKK